MGTSRVYFPKMNYPVSLSLHASIRMKQRAGLNSKKKRNEFLRRAAKGSLTVSDIPRQEEFVPLLLYLRNVSKNVQKKNKFCKIYFYKDYIFVISIEGVVITFLKVDEQYYGMYDKIKGYF